MKAELVKELSGVAAVDPLVAEGIIERTLQKAMKICDIYYWNPAPSQKIIKHELEALLK